MSLLDRERKCADIRRARPDDAVARAADALVDEKRALEFFTGIVETTRDAKITQMAAEFVEEEAEHVNLVHRLLRKYPEPAEDWAEDPDPPNTVE